MFKNGLKMVSETGTKFLSLFFIQIWSPVGVDTFLLYKCDIFFNIWSEANCQTNKNNNDKRTPRKLILNIKTQFCYCVTL